MRQWWTGISHSKDSVLPSTGLQSPTCSMWSGTVQSQNGSMGSFPGSKSEIHLYLLAPVSGRRWGKNAEGDSLVIAEDQDREIVSQHNLCFEYFSMLCLGCMLIFSVCYHPVKMEKKTIRIVVCTALLFFWGGFLTAHNSRKLSFIKAVRMHIYKNMRNYLLLKSPKLPLPFNKEIQTSAHLFFFLHFFLKPVYNTKHLSWL